jgi:hypothetical protein
MYHEMHAGSKPEETRKEITDMLNMIKTKNAHLKLKKKQYGEMEVDGSFNS